MQISLESVLQSNACSCYTKCQKTNFLGEVPELLSTLPAKGSSTINATASKRDDGIHTVPGEVVHTECRRTYCDRYQPKTTATDTQRSESERVLRSAEEAFSFKSDCLFCGKPAKYDDKHRNGARELFLLEQRNSKVCYSQHVQPDQMRGQTE